MWGHGDSGPLQPQGEQPRSDPDEPADLNASAAGRKRRWAPAIGAAGVLAAVVVAVDASAEGGRTTTSTPEIDAEHTSYVTTSYLTELAQQIPDLDLEIWSHSRHNTPSFLVGCTELAPLYSLGEHATLGEINLAARRTLQSDFRSSTST
jgi:hypothetical protein